MSIQKKVGKNGVSYKIVIELEPVNGKRRQYTETVKGSDVAKKRERELLTQKDKGNSIDPAKINLGDYLTKWFSIHEKSLASYTVVSYRNSINKHIIPALGNIPLKKLNTLHIQSFIDEKELSAGTLRNILQVLKTALNKSIEWQLLNRNPAKFVKLPSQKKLAKEILNEQEISHLLEEIKTNTSYVPCFIAIYTGMRLGEILGLQWDSINLDNKIIEVKQQLILDDKKLVFGSPKNNSMRTINIADVLIKFLKQHKKAQAAEKLESGDSNWNKDNLVCCRYNGKRIRPNTITVSFSELAQKLGYNVSFHGLRHTHASLLLKAGIPPKVVSERLGHSTISITMDTYSHVIPGMQQEAADKLDQLLSCD